MSSRVVLEKDPNQGIDMGLESSNGLRDQSATISLHDIASCVMVIDVMDKRQGFKNDEIFDVLTLRNKLATFLNENVPENYDIMEDREKVRVWAENNKDKEPFRDLRGVKPDEVDKLKGGVASSLGGAPFPIT
ncbi:MAG: hypothetical protein NZ824_11585 [Candidatus Thioglobus sp.]|nr:hypothetical protein [Candidatus Thioglobus sp.]